MSRYLFLLLFLLLIGLNGSHLAANGNRAMLFEVDGAIGPATVDYLQRGFRQARDSGAPLIILRMDTPGGLDNSMRDIIRLIIDSPVPVATYVAPGGARAASAGTYILYASHVAAMAPGTNLGAATPVQIGGGGFPPGGGQEEGNEGGNDDAENGEDGEEASDRRRDRSDQPASASERKVLNDAIAYIRALADMRDRNADWAEEAVREAASLGSREALEKNVIDILADNMDDLLTQMDGRTVKVSVGETTLRTEGLQVQVVERDWRNELLAIITNPNVAYILMLVGVYGLFFELANPGAIVPGVLGGISILLALFAFQALPINYAGLALMGLGLAFIIGEAFMPSFGILGIGGLVAFALGSLLLIDTGVAAYELSMTLVLSLTAVSGIIVFGIATMALKAHRRQVTSGREQILQETALAVEDFSGGRGKVRLQGELWNAEADGPVARGQPVRVVSMDGLKLKVASTDQTAGTDTSQR